MVHMLRTELLPVKDKQGTHLPWIYKLFDNEADQVVAYERADLVFIFNWNGQKSFTDYGIPAPAGKYQVILNTDSMDFAGFGLTDDKVGHFTQPDPAYLEQNKGWLKIYLPARTAVVLKKQ